MSTSVFRELSPRVHLVTCIMMLFRIVLIVLCAFECSGSLNDQCVTNIGTMIDCKNITILKPFGSDRTDQVQIIIFDSCDFPNNSIDNNDFHAFNFLNTLIIINSSLSTVGKSVFNEVRKLVVVNIENTEWMSIHPGQFKNNIILSKLHLSHNKITSIPEDTFPSSLTDLDLSYNRISSISRFAFKDLLDLQTLKLSGNLLTSLRSDFGFPSSLKYLYLDSNSISMVEPSTFSNCESLKELSLSFNHLRNIPNVTFCDDLAILRLDNNLISHLSSKLFSELDLKYLYLHGNNLKHVDLNELQFNSIIQLHIDSHLLENNLNHLLYVQRFEGIVYIHIRVSEYRDIELSFKSVCASETCNDVIKNSINHEMLRCRDDKTCLLKIPNVFGHSDDQNDANKDNYVCKGNCSCIVNETNFYDLIILNNIITYLIAFVLYFLYLKCQSKNKLSCYSTNESDQPDSSQTVIEIEALNEEAHMKKNEDSVSGNTENSESQEASPLLSGEHSSGSQDSVSSAEHSHISKHGELDTPSSNAQSRQSEFRSFPAQTPAVLSNALPQTNIHHVPVSEKSLTVPASSAIHNEISNAYPQGNFSKFSTVSIPRSVETSPAEAQDSDRILKSKHSSETPKVLYPFAVRITPAQTDKPEDSAGPVENSSVLGTKSTGRNSLLQARANNYNHATVEELPSVHPKTLHIHTNRSKPPEPVERQNDTKSLQERMTAASAATPAATINSAPTPIPTHTKKKKNLEPERRRTFGGFPNEEGELFEVFRRKFKSEWKLGEEASSQLNPKPFQPPPTASSPNARPQSPSASGSGKGTPNEKAPSSVFRRQLKSDWELGEESSSQLNPKPFQPPPTASSPNARPQSPPASSSGKGTPNQKAPASFKKVSGGVRPASSLSGTSPSVIIIQKESSTGRGQLSAAIPKGRNTAVQSTPSTPPPASFPGALRKGANFQTSQSVGLMINHDSSWKPFQTVGKHISMFEGIGRQQIPV